LLAYPFWLRPIFEGKNVMTDKLISTMEPQILKLAIDYRSLSCRIASITFVSKAKSLAS